MSSSGASAEASAAPLTPSDTLLLSHERFAAVAGSWHQFKRKAIAFLTLRLAILAAVFGAVIALLVPLAFAFSASPWLLVAVLALAGGLVFWFRQTISAKWRILWSLVKAHEKRRDGTVSPFQRGLAVLDEQLAMAMISSALLANESAGVAQLVLDGRVLQVVPTGAGTLWPRDSLEDRLRRDRRLPVAELVHGWLALSCDVPYRRAVELAEQGMVTRGLAVNSQAGDHPEAALTEATRAAAKSIDGSAASALLEACQRERPQIWSALQSALAAAFKKRRLARETGLSFGKSIDMETWRDAPLGMKVVNEKAWGSEVDASSALDLEASPVASAADRPADEYAKQRAMAEKLPSGFVWLINLVKRFLAPTSAEVQAAIQSRLKAETPTVRHETVDTSPSTPVGQQASIPMRIFAARELPPPTAAHRERLNRDSRDWAWVLGTASATHREGDMEGSASKVAIAHLVEMLVPWFWRAWRRRRARARLRTRMSKPLRLLMLRVFGSPSYDDLIALIQPWLRVGVIQHLEGYDTIGTRPEAISAVMAGRLEDVLVETKEEVERELSALSMEPDNELHFARQSFQCTATTWQIAVRGMMDAADAVVMDLSSLSPTNQGCAWEIGQLLDRVPLSRVTLLINDSTDLLCLQAILDDAARRVAANSQNRGDSRSVWQLVRIGGLAARQPAESHFDWTRRIDTRLEPEILTSFLMSTAEPRRSG